MPQPNISTLLQLIAPERAPTERFISDARRRVAISGLARGTNLACELPSLKGRSVMIATDRQLPAAMALAALDGVAARILLCTPDLSPTHVLPVMGAAAIDTVVTDGTGPTVGVTHNLPVVACSDHIITGDSYTGSRQETEWVLLTSGTTGRPKLVAHTLASLTGPLSDGVGITAPTVWTTFYDIRRYGGLQILLRAFGGGGSMVLSDLDEPVGDFLARAGAERITHISGTPSHWRRVLMSPECSRIAPNYVRLSGEACDQAVLNQLGQAYPSASVSHAFASTEAGVAFDVRDGKAGFPADLVGNAGNGICLRVEGGTLRIRSDRTAKCYLGDAERRLKDAAGFVDTGDLVELRNGRFYFSGRREGIINVGGLKVQPEAVEAVLNEHTEVRMSRVSSRANPITGALVMAEVVLVQPVSAGGGEPDVLKAELLDLCRKRLAAHEIPALVRIVPSIDIAPSGKLIRRHE